MGYIVIGIVIVFIGAMFYLTSSNTSAYSEPYFSNSSPVWFFYRDDCIHCQHMIPILTELAKQGYRVKPVEFYSHPTEDDFYHVQGTPTWVNPTTNDTLVGETDSQTLQNYLDKNGAKIV